MFLPRRTPQAMLEQLFPKHVLEYISAAADAGQAAANGLHALARSHDMVTVLFTVRGRGDVRA